MESIRNSERRNFIRAPVNINVFCAIKNVSSWLDVYTINARNISRKGIFLNTIEIIHPGSEIYLQFYLPQQRKHFSVAGKVIWNRYDEIVKGMGVCFTQIDDRYEEMIEHYVLKNYDLKTPSKY